MTPKSVLSSISFHKSWVLISITVNVFFFFFFFFSEHWEIFVSKLTVLQIGLYMKEFFAKKKKTKQNKTAKIAVP